MPYWNEVSFGWSESLPNIKLGSLSNGGYPLATQTKPNFLMSFQKTCREKAKSQVLSLIEEGATKSKAAKTIGYNRLTLYRWLEADGCFSLDFDEAWETGKQKREYLLWLNHPFRGLRPPTGKGTRSRPRYSQ